MVYILDAAGFSQSWRPDVMVMMLLLLVLRLLRTTGHIRHVGRGPMVHDLRLA